MRIGYPFDVPETFEIVDQRTHRLWGDPCFPCELGRPDAFLLQALEDLRVRRTHVVEPLLGEAIEHLALDELTKPEAQYFGTERGTRTGSVFFDLADLSDIPPIAEPLFQELNATVEFIPVMNGDELGAGLGKASSAWV